MYKKLLAILMILSLLAVGCTSNKDVAKEEQVKEITIAIFPYRDLKSKLQKAKEKFELEHDNVKVNIREIPLNSYRTTIEEEHKGGNSPDLIMLLPSDVKDYSNQHIVMDLNPFIRQDQINSDETFFSFLNDLVTVNGELTSLPISSETMFMLYNEKEFKDAGIAEPSEDWTWEDVIENAKKLKAAHAAEPRFVPLMLPADSGLFENLVLSNGGSLLSEDGLTAQGYLDSEAAVRTVQWILDITTKDQVARVVSFSDLIRAFQSERTKINQSAMFPVSANLRPYLPLDQGYKIARWPHFANGVKANTSSLTSVGISAHSNNPKEAWAFLKQFTIENSEITQDMIRSNLVVTRSVLDTLENDPIIQITLQEFEHVKPSAMYRNKNFLSINDYTIGQGLYQMLIDAENGKAVDIQSALTKMARQMEDELRSEEYIPFQ